jgi:hypothetical protein
MRCSVIECARCKRFLPGLLFESCDGGTLATCEPCRGYIVKSNKNRRRRNRSLVDGILRRSRCADCDTADWRVLEFDHLRDKEHNVSDMGGSSRSEAAIMAEIEKCEVVCANCHRIRTYERRRFERLERAFSA